MMDSKVVRLEVRRDDDFVLSFIQRRKEWAIGSSPGFDCDECHGEGFVYVSGDSDACPSCTKRHEMLWRLK